MKKQLLLSIALVAVCGIVAFGCKGEEAPAASNQPAAELTPQGVNAAGTAPAAGGSAASSSLATPGAPPPGPNGSPP
jgi:hypothetical protein